MEELGETLKAESLNRSKAVLGKTNDVHAVLKEVEIFEEEYEMLEEVANGLPGRETGVKS